jgi:hypothetical protein
MKSLSRLTWAGKTAIGLVAKDVSENGREVDSESMPNNFIEFNEQLILGYFEKAQISVSLLLDILQKLAYISPVP